MSVFNINLETFCDSRNPYDIHQTLYKVTDEARERIGRFLFNHGLYKGIAETYLELIDSLSVEVRDALISQLPIKKRPEGPFDTPTIEAMINQIYNLLHIVNDQTKINWYSLPFYEKQNFNHTDVVVTLNQNLDIDYKIPSHQELFRFLFATIFSQTSQPEELLSYHFSETFKGDVQAYKVFLYKVEKDNAKLIEPGLSFWKLWIETNIRERSDETPQQSENALFFKSQFKNVDHYRYIIDELSKSELGKWFDPNGNFIRVGRGNDNPSATGTLLTLLIERNYLKDELKPWTLEKKALFIRRAFGVQIGLRSRNLKTNSKQLDSLNFIQFRK